MDKKRKKNSYGCPKKKFIKNCLEADQHGFIITCNFNEKKSLIECYNILDTFFNLKNEVEKINSNVDDELEKELNLLKAEKPFKQVMTKCKNVVFVKLDSNENPIEIMNSIFENIEKVDTYNCRYICKMIPIMKTTSCSKSNIISCLEPILKNEQNEELTYKIEMNCRINSSFVKDEIFKEIGKLVKGILPKWIVNLDNPKKLIYIDVLHKIVCISILDDYYQRSKFNLNIFSKKKQAILKPIETTETESKN